MKFLSKSFSKNPKLYNRIALDADHQTEIHQFQNINSRFLNRDVRVDLYLPPGYYQQQQTYPVLLFNDGQDMEAAQMAETLTRLYAEGSIQALILMAVHAGDRMQEYGVIGQADYKNRGSQAGAYAQFILEELFPMMRARYRMGKAPQDFAVAGFSLGGLSALSLGWHHPEHFGQVGVFSGSLWWRSQPSQPKDPDAHRIMHDLAANSKKRPGLRFWFECGTKDETEDRNNNGIIDAIDDTLDFIKILKQLGYHEGRDILYLEVINGEHNHHTWAKVMPDFLQWAFGK